MKIIHAFKFIALCAILAARDALRPRMHILKEADLRQGFNVLDYGCGPGAYIPPLAKLVGPSGKIYALDINPLAVRRVSRLSQQRGLANVETILLDGSTGLLANSVDVVLLYDVFHLLADPVAVLREIHRVLKPEGFISFSDHHMSNKRILGGMTAEELFSLSRIGRYTYKFIKVI